jgi:hypothetical protein
VLVVGVGFPPPGECIVADRGALSRVESQNRDSASTGTRSRVGVGAVLD